MISIKKTEALIESLIEPDLVVAKYGDDCPAYRLRIFPGTTEQLGKPISCMHVHVMFKRVDYDDSVGNRFSNCKVTQLNKVYFDINIEYHKLRSHSQLYCLAECIIQELRGKKILVANDDVFITGQSPAEISDYSFSRVDPKSTGYHSTITVSASFSDVYSPDVGCC